MKNWLVISGEILIALSLAVVFAPTHDEREAYYDAVHLLEEQAALNGEIVQLGRFDQTNIIHNGRSYTLKGYLAMSADGHEQYYTYELIVSYGLFDFRSPAYKWEMHTIL